MRTPRNTTPDFFSPDEPRRGRRRHRHHGDFGPDSTPRPHRVGPRGFGPAGFDGPPADIDPDDLDPRFGPPGGRFGPGPFGPFGPGPFGPGGPRGRGRGPRRAGRGDVRLAVLSLLNLTFLAVIVFRLAAPLLVPDPPPDFGQVPDAELPVYTVLVALYREAEVVPRLVAALKRLDYPVLCSKLTGKR